MQQFCKFRAQKVVFIINYPASMTGGPIIIWLILQFHRFFTGYQEIKIFTTVEPEQDRGNIAIKKLYTNYTILQKILF